MVKKFLLFLMLLMCILPVRPLKAQTANDIRLKLLIDDTVYYEQKVCVTVLIESERFFPQSFEMNNYVVPSRHSFNFEEHCVYLVIEHDGCVYEEAFPMIIISNEPKRMRVSRFRPIKLFGLFYFSSLLSDEVVNSRTKEELHKVLNNDFGEYQMQAVFVTTENDTIRSKPISIMYKEK